MAPSDTFTSRPAVLLLAGVTVTLAALLIRQLHLRSEATSSDTGLHRSNAVLRPHTRRRRRANDSGSSTSLGATVTERAISRLLNRNRTDTDYGTSETSVNMGALGAPIRLEIRLIPSELPSIAELRSVLSMPETAAQQVQREIHSDFVNRFLDQEYPRGHFIPDEEAEYLCEQLSNLNVEFAVVEDCIADYNAGRIVSLPFSDLNAESSSVIHLSSRRGVRRLNEPLPSADGVNDTGHDATTQALDTRETVADDQSYSSRRHNGDGERDDDLHNKHSLIYRITQDSRKQEYYVHRGVMCNGCRIQPIQGVRYSCANCPDYDLCEDCEALQIHIKTHIFLKVRIPAPLLGYHRPTAPPWYPGKPHLLMERNRRGFPKQLKTDLCRSFHLDPEELWAHWEQFMCLASCSWTADPHELGLAIDRDGFDKCFCPPTSLRSPPPNLIYDRMFAFYDTNHDGKIGFGEFLKGLVDLQDTSREAQLRRIFRTYDMDNDGFVSRKDFLRLFRAYYSYSKEMAIASVAALDPNRDDPYARDAEKDEVRRKVEGGRPISAIFDGSIPIGHASRDGVGKSVSPDANGDLTIVDMEGVLDEDEDDVEDRNDVIGYAALGNHALRSSLRILRHRDAPNDFAREELLTGHAEGADVAPPSSEATIGYTYRWAPVESPEAEPISTVEAEDIFNALGRDVPLEEVIDPLERARVISVMSHRVVAEADGYAERVRQQGIHDRWQRQKFYTDAEEGATVPPGYVEADSSDDEGADDDGIASPDSFSGSKRQSLRSRSSSKVRFEDEITDTDYETRSNTSSRSIPVGERWGGYEVREVEKDVGKEVLYQAIQQGFNELLDPLFKEKEDQAIAADGTRALRRKWKHKNSEHAEPEHELLLARQTGNVQPPRQTTESDATVALTGDTVPSSSTAISDPTMPQNRPDSSAPLDGDIPNHPLDSRAPSSGSELIMPQNRPDTSPPANYDGANESMTVRPAAITTRAKCLAALNAMGAEVISQPQSLPLPPPSAGADPEPSAETLALWAQHDAIDAEAKNREGQGRLDYEEFAKKMVEEDDDSGAVGEDDVKGEKKWGKKASIGRLWFVGTWIEQSSF